MTFVFSGCVGLTKHSSQTPWGALGLGAINGNTPSLGAGGATGGFGTPGQGGGSTGSGMGGEGTPVAGMYFFHRDQVGSTRLMTNSAGEMVAGSNGAANIVYNPYGDIDVDHSHGPDILRNKFTGQQLDNESGLYYYNARYYDPALGRFITADSVMDTGGANGMNRYMYTNGNPVLRNDPSGHDAPKWMTNMGKDIKQAMVESVVQQAGAPLTLAYMNMNNKSNSDYRKRTMIEKDRYAWLDRQVVNPIQHMNTTELVIGGYIFAASAIVTVLVTYATGGVGTPQAVAFLAGVGTGLAASIVGQITGRATNGYSESNLKRAKWNGEKADRGQNIGKNAASSGNTLGGFFKLGPGGIDDLGNPRSYILAANWSDISPENFYDNASGAVVGFGLGEISGKAIENNFGSGMQRYTDNANTQNWHGNRQISHMDNIYKERTPYYWYSGNQRNVEFMAQDLFTEAVGNDICNGCRY